MSRITEFIKAHPEAVLALSIIGVAYSLESYVSARQWYDAVKQIEASEALGG